MENCKTIIENAAQQPTAKESENMDFLMKLRKKRITKDSHFPPPTPMITCGGIGCCDKGDIHAFKAKAKQGKTSAVTIMASAILAGSWGQLKCPVENAKVLWLDNEQKEEDVESIYNRIAEMTRLELEELDKRLFLFPLRSFFAEEKFKAVESLMKEVQPDIVFIDGIVDIVGDFNSLEESKKVIEHLMRLTTDELYGKETAIVCVLHTNKSLDDHNMRGHLGTMLTQKAGTVLEVTKRGDIFTVSNTEARHEEIPGWSFRYDNGTLVDATEHAQRKTIEQQQARANDQLAEREKEKMKRIDDMKNIFLRYNNHVLKSTLKNELMTAFGRKIDTVSKFLKERFDEGMIRAENDYVVYVGKKAERGDEQNLTLF